MSYGANDPNGLPLGLPSILSLGLPPLVNPYPALNLDFINNQTLDSRVTFSRGSQATLFDSTGTLVYAKHNLILQSQTFQTTWTAAEASITTDATVAPNGTQTADKLVENTASGVSHRVIQTGAPLSASNSATLSFYAKAAERNIVRAQLYENASGGILTGFFDLSLGTVTSTSVTGTASGVSGTITLVGDGWYRCTLSGIPYTSGTLASVAFTLVSTGTTVVYTGDGTSGIFLWGAQLNLANIEGGVTSSLTTYYPTTTAAYYAPRFDYNPSTLQPLGLLIEEARTNLLLQSQFAASWINFGTATQTINNAVAPDGTTTANLVSSPAATDYVYQAPTTVIGTSYAFSFFVKNSTATISHYQVRTSSTAAFGTLTWSGATLTAVTPTIGTASFVDVGNGWYRVIATYTATETAARHRIGGGDNTSTTGNVFVWGAQLEAGAFATSYIPTTTTALTRNADVASMTGTNFSSWYNASEGTIYGQSVIARQPAATANILAISDGTADNFIDLRYRATGTVGAQVFTLAAVQVNNTTGPTATANLLIKDCFAFAANNAAESINGLTPIIDSSISVPTVNRMFIGANPNGNAAFLNGYIQRIAYYPTRLPNSTLQALTA